MDKALAGKRFPPGHVDKTGGDNGCGTQGAHFASVGLVLDNNQGLERLRTDPAKSHDGDINGRRAIMEKEPIGADGDCAIAVEAGSKAIARVNVSSGLSTDEACQFIQTVAERIEPQLPKGK